jgi:uncharacterized protein (DUF1697 family)
MKWVALLRAVNLGARNKVPMAELRKRLEAAGYEDVRTYIASGNVILDGPRSRAAAERFAVVDPSPDRAVLAGTEVYLQLRAGVRGSRLSAAQLERLLSVPATLRNWRTVAKLAELAADA